MTLRLPHRIIYAPKVARFAGHTGITVLFWTFCAKRNPSARFVRHEYRHVQQWCVLTALAALLVVAAHVLFSLSLWLLLASPLGFAVPYFAAMIPRGYRASWFEKDAERYADGANG